MSHSPDKKAAFTSPPLDTAIVAELDVLNAPHDVEPEAKAFSNVSAFGFAFAVLNTWVVLVVGLGSALLSGGPSAALWGFVYAFICNQAITLSHSEILAVIPTTAGQWHWVAFLSPASWRASLSWTTAMANIGALWLGQATVGFLATTLISSAISVVDSSWAPSPAIRYGIFAASTVAGPLLTVTMGQRGNRLLDIVLMLASIGTALALFVTLLAMAKPKATAALVFGGTFNASGWDSMVIAWLLGILQSAFSFLGFDLVYHISEEMPNPRREGPKVVNMTILIGGISGILVTLAMLFAVPDVGAILSTPLGLPFAQIVLDATGSKAATVIFLLIPAILFMNSSRGICACAARVMLSVSRDNVLPRSKSLQMMWRGEPIIGLVLSTAVALLLGLVQLGSTAAFSSLLGSSVILFQITYVLPPLLMLLGGRQTLDRMMPARTSNLGKVWGPVANIVSCLFVLEGSIIYCFPATLPVIAGSMNYVIVYMAGLFLILVVSWYLWARHHYKGPDLEAIMRIANRNGDTRVLVAA